LDPIHQSLFKQLFKKLGEITLGVRRRLRGDVSSEGDEEQSQFILSAHIGDLDAVRSFLDHSEVTIDAGHSAHTGKNAVHAAVIGQQHQVLEFLLAHGADVHSMTPTGVVLCGAGALVAAF
jgi:hypothetical protein